MATERGSTLQSAVRAHRSAPIFLPQTKVVERELASRCPSRATATRMPPAANVSSPTTHLCPIRSSAGLDTGVDVTRPAIWAQPRFQRCGSDSTPAGPPWCRPRGCAGRTRVRGSTASAGAPVLYSPSGWVSRSWGRSQKTRRRKVPGEREALAWGARVAGRSILVRPVSGPAAGAAQQQASPLRTGESSQ